MKERLMQLIERESTYLSSLKEGSDEYYKSLEKLQNLEKQLFELEQFEAEIEIKQSSAADSKKDKKGDRIIEGLKVASGVVMPLIGYVCIVAAEKQITFTGALKDVTKCFLPKR